MKHIIGALKALLLLPLAALAEPPCYPSQDGCTRAYIGVHTGGYCLQWYTPEPAGMCGEIESLPGAFESIYKNGTAWWAENVTRTPEEFTPAEKATWAALLVHRPQYRVAPTLFGSRPVYQIVDGKRVYSGTRIAVGEPCDCSTRDGSYCAVPGGVAVCSRAAPL